MACGRGCDPLDRRVHAGAAIQSFQVLGQRPQRGIAVLAAEQCRERGYAQRIAAELLDLESEPLEIGRVRRERLASSRRQLDEHRYEQALALEPAARQALGDPLEQHALVRHVLIDDRNPLIVNRDDESVSELP